MPLVGAIGPMAIGRWYDRAGFYEPRFVVYLACVAFIAVAISLLLPLGRKHIFNDAGRINSAAAIPLED
jgi:hypothetical protein